jgi:aminopeptidase N
MALAHALRLVSRRQDGKLSEVTSCRTTVAGKGLRRQLWRVFPLEMLAALLAATAPAAPPPPQAAGPYMGRGVSRALAEHRARTLGLVRYALSLDVRSADSAVGRVAIRFDLKARGDVVLDFRGRRLTSATANGRALPKGAANGSHIRVPMALLSLGENRLELAFVADIAPSGASIIRFHDQTDGSDYLYTLLVPADANQLFPCFDQPDLKGRVGFALTAPAAWRVLANGPEIAADTAAGGGGGGVTHRFAETQPLSTYQIAFAAGPWHRATATAGGRTIGAWVRRSRAREADLDSLLAANLRALAWMERYFARAYPFGKFEFLLAPAFPFGGMEHPGAVFYNEDRFIFRERPTLPQRLGRTSTVLHEVAHMWFGDLVTMRWFDDLWLKEGFATYMAAKALADLDSTSGAWKTFYLANKPAAYGVDQTDGTTPLWQALDNLDQAKSNYGAIVYNKAPAVLKQLNYLVGEPAFRAGVQTFLARHAFANATWKDLLAEIGRAWGRPLDDFGRQFILRPGMSEVEQRLTVRNGRIARLELVQRPVRTLSGPGPWPMRTQVLLAYADAPPAIIPVELSGAVTDVADAVGKPAPRFVYANAGDYGYMLTRLDSTSLAALERGALGQVDDAFLRAMLWGALWDEVRAARMAPAAYVELALRELPRERDEQILPRVLGRARRALAAYLGEAERERLQPQVERFLWAGANDVAAPFGIRKAYLDAFVGAAATPDGTSKVASLVSSDSAAGAPVGNPTRWDAVTRLLVVAAPDAERLLALEAARDSSPDGRRRAFVAGAARDDSATKRTYFERYFADPSLNEDWASGSLGAFNALEHQALTLPYLKPALDSLRYIQANRRIFFLGAWLGAFLSGQTSDAALGTVRRFLAAGRLAPDLRRKVLESADELERTVEVRRRFAPARRTP